MQLSICFLARNWSAQTTAMHKLKYQLFNLKKCIYNSKSEKRKSSLSLIEKLGKRVWKLTSVAGRKNSLNLQVSRFRKQAAKGKYFTFLISQRLQTGPRKRTKNEFISSQSCTKECTYSGKEITPDYKCEAKNKEARQRIRGERDIWRIFPSL